MSRRPRTKKPKNRQKDRPRSVTRGALNRAETLRQRGDQLVLRGKMPDAANSYRRALLAEPEDAATLGKLANTLACQGKLAEAITHTDRALALEPGNVSLITNLGILLRRAQRTEDAIICFKRALAVDPRHPNTLYHLAELHHVLGARDEANRYFRQTVESYQAILQVRSDDGRPADDYLKLGSALKHLGRREPALAAFARASTIAPTHALAWVRRGLTLVEMDRNEEALVCYQRAASLKPADSGIQRELGLLLLRLERLAPAAKALAKVAQRHPDDSTVKHLLAAATPGSVPTEPPRAYVEGLFDGYADRFDGHLVGDLGYRAPWLLRAALAQVTGLETAQWTIMDLGCGTGLCGPLLRDLATRLIGVDLSRKMLAKARALDIYDELREEDLTAALAAEDSTLDLVIAADVFIYVGDLTQVFAACRSALLTGGRFAFTTEPTAGDRYKLEASGRYTHGRDYIEALAAAHNFQVDYRETVVVRYEGRQPVSGDLFILTRR